MNSDKKRSRSLSNSGSLPLKAPKEPQLKRRGSIDSHSDQNAPLTTPPQRQRHAFLPGLAAFDPNHSFAAAMELRAHKTSSNAKYAPGHLFVENEDARKSVVSLLTTKRQTTQDQTEIANIDHALTHIHVIGSQSQSPLGSGTGGDKLYVKGHGSSKNKNEISTTTVTRKREKGIVLESGYKRKHSAQQIAQGINAVRNDLGADKLDIRLTSCGSAGGYTKTIDQYGKATFTPVDKANTFGGSVQNELDQLRANTFTVHGYRGDANTSFPVARQTLQGTFKHFRTTVKDDGSGHQIAELPKLFNQQAEPQTIDRRIKARVGNNTLQQKNLTHPQAPVLPQNVAQQSTATSSAYGFKKNVQENRFETRRSSTRVKIT